MSYPGFLEEEKLKHPIKEIISVIKDPNRVGSLSFTLQMLSNVNANVKNLLTMEAWRIFDKFQREWYVYTKKDVRTYREHLMELDKLLIYLMAYKELIDESIFKEQGLILYNIGYKIEVSQLLISKLRSLLTVKLDKLVEYDILDSTLNSYESYNSYRSYYQSSLSIENVLEFLLFNKQYPKSLIYIIYDLLQELEELPHDNKTSITNFQEPVFKIYSNLTLTKVEELLELDENDIIYKNFDEFLSNLSNLLSETSEELTKTYFSHYNEN